ncbi:amino acid ABC transporter substrate-binding protein [Pseudoalteromonas sp. MMG010]|uniref:amino acid ABC transporter substrate-binding protein n=1 Tax=Pseudoalteromonas sp. MMG010 TaxID=2822685 RepID=UPI001B3A1E44|nr:amino acid ABC transporter substrate-binding protein [Pseudoalteromonas sp. MMG010]MBQ4833744.1 amino acid ABC transporter substrate-binding protein [Pseudoalteromonas sp. MMG010]
MRYFSFKYIMLVSILFLYIVPSYAKPTVIKFCYEDKHVPPMYAGEGLVIPTQNPGASIEILRKLDASFNDMTIEYIRAPWRRCLADLKNNKVHSIIATYRAARKDFAVYPTLNNRINERGAISRFGMCLVGESSFRNAFVNSKPNNKKFSVAIPFAYGVNHRIDKTQFTIYNTLSNKHSYTLLEKGVVDASLDICQINGENVAGYPFHSKVSQIYPPLHINDGYVVFSLAFYKQNETLTNKIWQWFEHNDTVPTYLKYMANLTY